MCAETSGMWARRARAGARPGVRCEIAKCYLASLGRPFEEQALDRDLRPGWRGKSDARLTEETLHQRVCGTVPDWYGQVLSESDSLLLSPAQVTALTEARTAHVRELHGVW